MSSFASLGHLTSRTDAVLIIDLDETLISINSFPVWAKYFLLGKFENLNLHQLIFFRIKAAKIFAERKILGYSHAKTKNALQKLWLQTTDSSALGNILNKLGQQIRPNMLGILELITKNEIDAVLASAAASLYVQPLAKQIGFSHALSTGINDEENRSEEKSRRVQEFLALQGWESRKKIFFTDHLEDMPFILNSDKLMWFGKPEEIATIQKSAPELSIIPCKNLTAQEITSHVF